MTPDAAGIPRQRASTSKAALPGRPRRRSALLVMTIRWSNDPCATTLRQVQHGLSDPRLRSRVRRRLAVGAYGSSRTGRTRMPLRFAPMPRVSILMRLLVVLLLAVAAPLAQAESLSHGRFKNVQI